MQGLVNVPIEHHPSMGVRTAPKSDINNPSIRDIISNRYLVTGDVSQTPIVGTSIPTLVVFDKLDIWVIVDIDKLDIRI